MTTKADTSSNLLNFEELTSFSMEQVIKIEAPEIPKNGKPGVLLIKALSAQDVISLIEFNEKNKDNEAEQRKYMFTLIAQSLVNEKGEKLITTAEQRQALTGIPASLYRRLVNAVTKASGSGDSPAADSPAEAGKD